MGKLVEWTRRLNTAARMLEQPRLFRLLRAGGSPRLFLDLDLPWIKALGIQTILDIGANRGGFALTMRALFPAARIIAFEPLPELLPNLHAMAAADPLLTIAACGLGESNGTLTFNRLANDAASSFLAPNAVLKSSEPAITASSQLSVPVRRLDDVMAETAHQQPVFVKLDVQGFEDRVIAGGEHTLRRAPIVLIETSTIPLYDGAPDFARIAEQLAALGFIYGGTLERLVTLPNGRIASEDTIFVKREVAS